MNNAVSVDNTQLFEGLCSENLSSGSSSFLSEDFCLKVLGKPCLHYSKISKKGKKPERKKLDIKKKVSVYAAIKDTANRITDLKDSRDFLKVPNSKSEAYMSKESVKTSASEHLPIQQKPDRLSGGADDVHIGPYQSHDANLPSGSEKFSRPKSKTQSRKFADSTQQFEKIASKEISPDYSVGLESNEASYESQEFVLENGSQVVEKEAKSRSKILASPSENYKNHKEISQESSTILESYRPSFDSQQFEVAEEPLDFVDNATTPIIKEESRLKGNTSEYSENQIRGVSHTDPVQRHSRLNRDLEKGASSRFKQNISSQHTKEIQTLDAKNISTQFSSNGVERNKPSKKLASQKDFFPNQVDRRRDSVSVQVEQEHRPCYCDRDSQTRNSILKHYLERTEMDSHPVKDTGAGSANVRPKFADKTLQTSNDSLYKTRIEIASNTSESEYISRGINTMNTGSINIQVTEVSTSKVQTSNTSSTPIEICYEPVGERNRCNRSYPSRFSPRNEVLPPRHLDKQDNVRFRLPYRPGHFRPKEGYGDSPAEAHFCSCHAKRREVTCCCHCDDCHLDQPHRRSPTCMKTKAKLAPCVGQCRNCPPMPHRRQHRPVTPKYQFSGSDSNDDEHFDLDIDLGEKSDGYSSDSGQDAYMDLSYQNNEEYSDMVQELEESLQIRNKNRVQRTLIEFEKKSKCNKPLEKPIIDYEGDSESEEPLIRQISELAEKRKQSFPCKGKACCCLLRNNEKDRNHNHPLPAKTCPPPEKNHPPPVKSPPPPVEEEPEPIKKPHTKKHRWQQDAETGEWIKENPKFSRRPNKLPPRPQKEDHVCGCTCNCGR